MCLKKLCSYNRQEDTILDTTLSPVDVSANHCVVTGNPHEVSLLYGDVIAPQHHEVYLQHCMGFVSLCLLFSVHLYYCCGSTMHAFMSKKNLAQDLT